MIIADTGFWLALANRRDRFHLAAKQALEEIEEPLITTWPVMTETCHLLLSRLSPMSQERFIASFRDGAFTVFALIIALRPESGALGAGWNGSAVS